MSDLQCPARFLVLGGADAPLADALADSLRHERVAAVYDGQGDSAGSGAEALARRLGVPARVLGRALRVADVLAGDPVAMGDLTELSDLHRGETLVVTAAGDPGRRVDVSIDGDGTTVVEVSPGDAR